MPHEIFADEIAIDFPSVDPIVERVRDAFLGERSDGETLVIEASLSCREAAIGTTVPIEVPLRSACSLCGGRGETWSEPCRSCSGSGDALVRRAIRFSVPPGVANGARFRFRVSSPDATSVQVEVRVGIRNL